MESFYSLQPRKLREKKFNCTVYRSGNWDGKRADVLGQMAGRSTGYFGTGCYFCTDPRKVENLGEDRPIYSFKIEDLNLMYGTINNHDYLRALQRYVTVKPWLDSLPSQEDLFHLNYHYEKLFGEWDKRNKFGTAVRSLMEDGNYDYDSGEYKDYESWEQCKEDNMEEYQFKSLFSLIDTMECMKPFKELLEAETIDYDALDELDDGTFFNPKERDYARKVLLDIKYPPFEFPLTSEDIIKVADEVVEDLREYYDSTGVLVSWNDEISRTDSIPTRILRKLGFDGVYPTEECDSTTYGGVIFDYGKIKDVKRIR